MASLPALILPSRPWTARLICAEPRRGLVLLVAVEGDALHRVLAGALDEVAGLDEHAAGAAGRVEHDAVLGLDDVDDGLHDGRRRVELAVVVCALLGEFGEEVLVDAAEDVARRCAQHLGVERAHHAFEHVVVEVRVVLRGADRRAAGKRARSSSIAAVNGRAEVPVLGGLENLVEACSRWRKHQRAAPREVGGHRLAVGHLAGLLVGVDGPERRIVAVGGLPQEQQAHDRHEVLVGREIRVGAQVVRDLPEPGLELLKSLSGGQQSSC